MPTDDVPHVRQDGMGRMRPARRPGHARGAVLPALPRPRARRGLTRAPGTALRPRLTHPSPSAVMFESGGSVAVADLADVVLLAPREGVVHLRRGDEKVAVDPERLGVVPVGQSLELSGDDAEIDAVSFPRTALSRLLGAAIDPEGLDVGRLTPGSPVIVDRVRRRGIDPGSAAGVPQDGARDPDRPPAIPPHDRSVSEPSS